MATCERLKINAAFIVMLSTPPSTV